MTQVRLQNLIGRTSLVGQIVKLKPGSTKAYILADTPDPDAIGTVHNSVPSGYWGLVDLINSVSWTDIDGAGSSRTVTGTTTETVSDFTLVFNSATNVYCYLLEATGSNRVRNIANVGVGNVIVVPAGDPSDPSNLDFIDNESTQTVSQWENLSIIDYTLSNWKII